MINNKYYQLVAMKSYAFNLSAKRPLVFYRMLLKNYIFLLLLILTISCKNSQSVSPITQKTKTMNSDSEKVNEENNTTDWFAHLDADQYKVLKEKATERPFSGKYNLFFESGTYVCAACKTPLFTSDTKFDGHCGWPSFDKAIKGRVNYIKDTSNGMQRTEIVCATCGGHLGHVFDDGPTSTGKRYCVNSLSLGFQKDSVK